MEDQPQTLECPKCHEKFAIATTVRRSAETVVTMSYKLEPGHLVSPKAIGTSIGAFEDCMKLMSKDLGGKCLTLIKDMRFKDNEMQFDFLIVTPESSLYEANKSQRNKPVQEQMVGG